MRIAMPAMMALVLAGCSSEQHVANGSSTDVNAAAEAAQGDIDTYAANNLQAAPLPAPTAVASAAPAPNPTREVVAEAPFTSDSAQGAADVVQTYYALIEEKKYGQAYRLWEDGGRASGLGQRQFADSFARYAEYHAEVGAPGRVDAGAGQRYVEVPVKVHAVAAAGGKPFDQAGSATLHRVADIDGATAEQRSWRIKDSSLRPRAVAANATMPAAASATYRCAGETRISVRFDNDADTATVRRGGRDLAVLDGQRPASGIWYRGGGYELRGKGRDADFTAPGRPPVACTAN